MRTTAIQRSNQRIWLRKKISMILRYTVLFAVGIVMMYPLLWMLGSSFKADNTEIFAGIGLLPKKFSLDAYVKGWTGTGYPFSNFMLNTYKIVFPKVIGVVISSVLTAYGFARFKFRGRSVLFALVMSMLFLPQVVLNIPQYLLYVDLGWINTYLPLIVPAFFANEPYFIFLLVQFMKTIPREIEEAAEIDGCNSFRRLIYVIVPMIWPAVVSVALFQFMWASNDFQGPLIYINTVSKYPATMGLKIIMDAETGIEWNMVLALSVISILPTLLVFFLSQKQFIDGIAMGGVKG